MRLFYLVACVIFVTACQSELAASPIKNTDQAPPKSESRPTSAGCPGLDSQLFQLTQAADPLKLAEQWQLKVKGDKVQVLLLLAGDDITFLQNFEVEPGTSAGTKIQVFAPIARLCDLANMPQVLAIRPPNRAFSQ